jgi:hypothetical protein
MTKIDRAEHSRRHVVGLAAAGGLVLPCGLIAPAGAQEQGEQGTKNRLRRPRV